MGKTIYYLGVLIFFLTFVGQVLGDNENNDTIESSEPVSEGFHEGEVRSFEDDRDFYSIDVPSMSVFRISCQGESDSWVFFTSYNDQGKKDDQILIGLTGYKPEGSGQIDNPGLESRRYYIEVYGTGSYNFTVSYSRLGGGEISPVFYACCCSSLAVFVLILIGVVTASIVYFSKKKKDLR